ncbi:hypothetical protein K456DRAFT_1738282 [Colletotrichum gloeosporioides 23]|nr:hypothetical protein K456DRAFT_1738282 [Colletotrichum gloeosporioides 23]
MPQSRNKACIPCQKQKVRCRASDDGTPCQRCQKRGIQCHFSKIPQYWKPSGNEALQMTVAEDLETLRDAINNILANREQSTLGPLKTRPVFPQTERSPSPSASVASDQLSQSGGHLTGDSLSMRTQDRASVEFLTQIPIKSLYEITRLESLRSRQVSPSSTNKRTPAGVNGPRDLVTEGKLNLVDAKRLVQKFLDQTDHYLYGVTTIYQDLDGIRNASPLLFTAICTVSALHEPQGESLYRACSLELRKLVTNFVFAPQVSMGDFQGLRIASFWLSDMAWSVSGLAIRRAMEFQLGKAFDFVIGATTIQKVSPYRFQLGSREEAQECLRVWYLYYICDRHLSILYGRPSSFGDQISVNKWETYLNAVPENSTDVRLASQIEMILILDKVTGIFGTNVEVCIPGHFHTQLQGFNRQLDQWIMAWTGRYRPHERIGNFPLKALTLHHHFAKLFVSSHVYRGRSSHGGGEPVPPEYSDMAQVAVSSASAIVELIINDVDIRAAFVGMPHYCHTMIAYACSFLLKLATSQHDKGLNAEETFGAILKVADFCQNAQCTSYHLVHWMGAGLRDLAAKCENALSNQSTGPKARIGVQAEGTLVQDDMSMQQAHEELETSLGMSIEPGNAWDAARGDASFQWGMGPIDASLGNMSSGFINPTFDPNMGSEGPDAGWESLLPTFDLEHMGFGLL